MALKDLWMSDRSQITKKRVAQLIAFAGEGKLRDGKATSRELRELLAVVPSELIGEWIDECLDARFTDFGLVLQDIVNEIGRRLSFRVMHGVYRGQPGEAFDGLWQAPGGHVILVESKSSTSYAINLTRIAGYRKQIPSTMGVSPEQVSILVVVGTEDTDELEAQVRGSRYAWDVRLLGMKSLLRLLRLKETLDDPNVERQIQEILVPQEFTRLDRIVDLVFATSEETRSVAEEELQEPAVRDEEQRPSSPASFHAEVIPRLERHLGGSLVKRSRITWVSADDAILLSCQVSKEFDRTDMHYWFGLKRATKETLARHDNSFCAFGLGCSDRVLLMPFRWLAEHLPDLYTSPDKDGNVRHWHVRFLRVNKRIELLTCPDKDNCDVTEFLVP